MFGKSVVHGAFVIERCLQDSDFATLVVPDKKELECFRHMTVNSFYRNVSPTKPYFLQYPFRVTSW